MFRQMSEYFESFLSKYQCELKKGFSAQQCLLLIYCLWHELLIAKLNAYGFSIAALRSVENYLSNRKQRIKINSDFSSWGILFGVPQGSILGPLLISIS